MRAIYLSRFSLPFFRLIVVSRLSLFLILSHFLLFLLICILKNSSLHERQERTFPSLSLSLSSRIISCWRKEESISSSFFEGDDDDDGFAGLSLLLRCQEHHR